MMICLGPGVLVNGVDAEDGFYNGFCRMDCVWQVGPQTGAGALVYWISVSVKIVLKASANSFNAGCEA